MLQGALQAWRRRIGLLPIRQSGDWLPEMVAVPDRFVGVRGASSAADRRRAKEIGVTRALQHEVSVLQSEVKLLHSVLSQRLGLNSRGIKDAFGKEFAVSVDEEHKATTLRIFNFTNPHGRAFHTS